MAKRHNFHQYDLNLPRTERLHTFVHDLAKKVEADFRDRSDWRERKEENLRLRYCEEYRNVSFPWPGASDLVVPLLDKEYDRMKPNYLNMMFGADPPVTVTALTQEDAGKERNVEMMFDHWINHNGSPEFMREMFLLVDQTLGGRGICKSFWKYETRWAPETITRATLPPALQQLIVESPRQSNNGQILTGSLTRGEFRRNEKDLAPALGRIFQLDPDEPGERQQLRRIMDWFKNGAKGHLQIEKRDILVSAPAVMSVHHEDLVVPSNTEFLQDAERLAQVIYLSERQIRQKAHDNLWDQAATNELLDRLGQPKFEDEEGSTFIYSDNWRQDQQIRSGVSTVGQGSYERIVAAHTWYDYNNDGRDEKVVILYPSSHPDIILKAFAYPSVSGRWPFEESLFELNLPMYHSERGIADKLYDLNREVIATHRAAINSMMITTAPTFKYRRDSRVNLRGHHWVPGEGIPVSRMDDLDVLQIPSNIQDLRQEEQILRTWVEEYIGGQDHGLAGGSTLTEARTATEISSIKDMARQALSMRGLLFTGAMGHTFRAMHDLQMEYGDDELWLSVTGEAPQRVTREQLQGDFMFQIGSTIGDHDPVTKRQEKLMTVQVLTNIQGQGLMGNQFELNLGAAVVDWLMSVDPRLARRVVRERSPEEIQQMLEEQQRMQELAQAAEANVPMTEEEHTERLNQIKQQSPHGALQRIQN